MFERHQDKEIYTDLMEEIKCLNKEYLELKKGRRYRLGMALDYIGHLDLAKINFYVRQLFRKRLIKIKSHTKNAYLLQSDFGHNYFSKNRIAVYTVIFGKYDELIEPCITPDNCDFYVITDMEVSNTSVWKKIDTNEININVDNLSDIEKNRLFKMLPDLVFPEYSHSIYVDGNIRIVSDPTEYIYRIGERGIATHLHSERDCVYDECEAIRIYKRASKSDLTAYKKLLRENDMPRNYGLLECNIIVRNHNNPECQTLMREWWELFKTNVKRDQLLLPLVLYKNGVDVREIGTLGIGTSSNPSFQVLYHS